MTLRDFDVEAYKRDHPELYGHPSKRDIVTINALWKHWSAATTGAVVTDRAGRKTPTMADVATDAIDVFRRVTGGIE